MQPVVIRYKKMAKMLGVSVKQAEKVHDDLISKGYMEVLYANDKMRCVRISSPDPQMAAYLHQTRDPIIFTK
jgi:hypothetical protein